VKGFNDKELEDWKNGVTKGVEGNNWMDLIAHRTFHFSLDRETSRPIAPSSPS
jgi:hypothetical protein